MYIALYLVKINNVKIKTTLRFVCLESMVTNVGSKARPLDAFQHRDGANRDLLNGYKVVKR